MLDCIANVELTFFISCPLTFCIQFFFCVCVSSSVQLKYFLFKSSYVPFEKISNSISSFQLYRVPPVKRKKKKVQQAQRWLVIANSSPIKQGPSPVTEQSVNYGLFIGL